MQKAEPVRTIELTVFAMMLTTASYAEAITLTAAGSTSYTIVVGENAIASEKTAATELQSFLKIVTGVNFSIGSSKDRSAVSHCIYVGTSDEAKKLACDVHWKDLEADSIVIRTVRDDLILAGGRPRGTLYAVYTFLEDVVGVRWWSSTESYIPTRPTLEIGELNTVYTPKFAYREACYYDVLSNPVFATRLKMNGHYEYIPDNYGGHYQILGFVHTFYKLLPPEKYFKAHPEWYSMHQGERVGKNGQLCLTNEAMRKELTQAALEWIRKNPSAGMISISQNDFSDGRCECDKCKALEAKEGSASGPLIYFVNAVAADIAKEYPDFKIETLAYCYTRKPPLHVKAANNVIVRLCDIECSFNKPLTDSVNSAFTSDLVGWSKSASNLFVWDYVANFRNYLAPHPNLDVLAPNLRLYSQNKVIGVYEQGYGHYTLGEFETLRAWLMAHLLWNPAADEKTLRQEFLKGYYGPAAGYLSDYLDRVQKAGRSVGWKSFRCYNLDYSFLSLKDMNASETLWDQAENAVKKDSVLSLRVKRERLSFDLLWLLRYKALKEQASAEHMPFLGPEDPVIACEKFIQTVQDVTRGKDFKFSEHILFSNRVNNLRQRARLAKIVPAVPDQCKGLCAKDWLDVQNIDFQVTYSKEVRQINDPLASDGDAVNMLGNVTDWSVMYSIPFEDQFEDPSVKYHCYASVRCEATAKKGLAYRLGIHDYIKNRSVVVKEIGLDMVSDGAYHLIDLGIYQLTPAMAFWIVPSGNIENVKSISIDRLVLVKITSGKK